MFLELDTFDTRMTDYSKTHILCCHMNYEIAQGTSLDHSHAANDHEKERGAMHCMQQDPTNFTQLLPVDLNGFFTK